MKQQPTDSETDPVGWIKQTGSVLLVDRESRVIARLDYPDAALWDFVTRNLPVERIVTMIRWIGGFESEETAQAYTMKTTSRWLANGWIKKD